MLFSNALPLIFFSLRERERESCYVRDALRGEMRPWEVPLLTSLGRAVLSSDAAAR
jgi:hypothetical protein